MGKTIAKNVSPHQRAAFDEACQRAQLTQKEAVDQALRAFVESQSVVWPETAKWGGLRQETHCRKCRGTGIIHDPFGQGYDCDRCGGSGSVPDADG